MRWGVALCALSVAVAMLARGVAAQEADEDDDNPPATTSKPSFWGSLLGPSEPSRPPFDVLTGGMPNRLLYFSGVEVQRWSLAAYAGAQWAPARIDRDGFILRMVMSDSIERYTTRMQSYDTNIVRVAIMPGYRFSRGKVEIQVFGGLGIEGDLLLVDRRADRLRAKVGPRIGADVWWEPSRLLMLQYSISGTTIDNAVSMRAAAGWRLFDRFWIGPETTASGDDFSRQYRVGAHFTGLRSDEYEWSVGAGHVWDSYRREGVYGRISVVIRPRRTLHLD
jgi:hypothetical protein